MVAETEQERVWFAREVFKLFVKCFTNLKLYPHHHAHCVDSLEEFSKRLRAYVKLHSSLRIGINQDTLTVEDQTVYESESRSENLAFRLYVDGLREVHINAGVTDEEARKLATIFYQTIVDTEVDSTLLLWEGDFKNVDHVAINSLTEAWESPDWFSADNLDLLKNLNNNVDQIVESLSANSDRGTYSFELTDGASELDQVDEVDADEGSDREGEAIFNVEDRALIEYRNEAASWGPDKLLKTLVDHVLDGYALVPELLGMTNVEWLLQEAVSMAMRSKDMELLSDLLSRYDGEMALLEDDPAEMVFKNVFAWMSREENVERLVAMGKGGALGGPKAYCRILSQLGEGGLKASVATYLQTEDEPLKEALLGFMQENLELNPMALVPMLTGEQEAETVKAALFVANKVLSGERLTQLLNVARDHKSKEITKYASHLWRTKTDEGRVVALLDSLTAESRNDRIRAVLALVKANYRPAVERIKQAIDASDFLNRDVQERQLFIEALRRLGGTTTVAFLENQTKRSTMLFNRKATKEVRELAKKALLDLRMGRP